MLKRSAHARPLFARPLAHVAVAGRGAPSRPGVGLRALRNSCSSIWSTPWARKARASASSQPRTDATRAAPRAADAPAAVAAARSGRRRPEDLERRQHAHAQRRLHWTPRLRRPSRSARRTSRTCARRRRRHPARRAPRGVRVDDDELAARRRRRHQRLKVGDGFQLRHAPAHILRERLRHQPPARPPSRRSRGSCRRRRCRARTPGVGLAAQFLDERADRGRWERRRRQCRARRPVRSRCARGGCEGAGGGAGDERPSCSSIAVVRLGAGGGAGGE